MFNLDFNFIFKSSSTGVVGGGSVQTHTLVRWIPNILSNLSALVIATEHWFLLLAMEKEKTLGLAYLTATGTLN